MDTPVYLDHAATTPLDPQVLAAMLPYFSTVYGNPAALYSVGMEAREGVEQARETVAQALNASPDEIVFTSGGTESDNLALHGMAASTPGGKRHILSTPIEHHAVLAPLETLERQGFDVELVPVDREGHVDVGEIQRRMRPDTLMVSVMHANNEIGTVQPIAEIGTACRERGIFFHTDAVQTFGKLPIDVRAMKIDLLSISAHKLYGPKGVGALYVRRGLPLAPLLEGGGQERGLRSGTLNVPGIVGLGTATDRAYRTLDAENDRLIRLSSWFLSRLLSKVPDVHVLGSRTRRLPFNICFCVEGVDGEPLLLALDAAGVCASAGSACSAGSTEPSHVLKAIGISRDLSRGALRLTLGRSTTEETLGYTLAALSGAVENLRSLTPVGSAAISATKAGKNADSGAFTSKDAHR